MTIPELIKKYPFIKESIFYVIIGGIATIAELVSYFLLRNTMDIYVSNFFAKSIGIIISFLLNSYINFKVHDNLLKRFIFFFGVGYAGLLISNLILHLGIERLSANEIVVKIISVLVAGVFQFLVNKFITFRKNRAKTSN